MFCPKHVGPTLSANAVLRQYVCWNRRNGFQTNELFQRDGTSTVCESPGTDEHTGPEAAVNHDGLQITALFQPAVSPGRSPETAMTMIHKKRLVTMPIAICVRYLEAGPR